MEELSVSVVVYRSDRPRLAATLGSLATAVRQLASGAGIPARLLVVDNGAREEPLGALPLSAAEHAAFASVERIDAERNAGFGAGHNLALGRTCCRYHLVLNPDVEMDSNALLVGIEWLRAPRDTVGVVPEGRSERGEPLYLAKNAPGVLMLLLRAVAPVAAAGIAPRAVARYELHELCASGVPASVPLASGCFMLLRGDVVAALGGFAPEYFLYFEDFDLSRRLARTGQLVYLPAMRIVHHGGGAARKGPRHILHFCRSAWRYFSRWGWRLL